MVHGNGQISEAELAAFADRSLSPRRRAQIAACIERSPEPAPPTDRAEPSLLKAGIAGVPFPNYPAPLGWHANARRTRRDGTELRHLRRGKQIIVTWLRAGQTCVLSAARLSRDELLELAAWNRSMDIVRIHTGLTRLPLHRLAA